MYIYVYMFFQRSIGDTQVDFPQKITFHRKNKMFQIKQQYIFV